MMLNGIVLNGHVYELCARPTPYKPCRVCALSAKCPEAHPLCENFPDAGLLDVFVEVNPEEAFGR